MADTAAPGRPGARRAALAAAEIEGRGQGLSPAERKAWDERGFFFREHQLSPSELEGLRDAAETIVAAAEGALPASLDRYQIDGNAYVEIDVGDVPATVQLEHAPGSHTVRVIEPFHRLDPRFERLVDDERIVAPMRGLIGSERVALFTDKLNCKRPREGSRFDWHQDSPYWAHFCEHLDRLPNVMVTLDDADRENGCFRLISGSHRRGMLPGREGEGVLGPLFTRRDQFREDDAVLVEVPAGSLVFFSPHIVHGSYPNRSARLRRALVLTYQPGGLRMFKVDRVRDAGAVSPA